MEHVSFPRLGLEVPVNRVAFNLFGLPIYTYAIIIAFALALSVFLALRHCGRHGIKQVDIVDIMIAAIPAGIVCARLYYVAFDWDSHRGDLMAIINIRQGGLAIYGAIIGAFAAAILVCRFKKINAIAFLDFGVPYIAMSQAIGRWGNFVNQEAFGYNTSMPWGMASEKISDYLASRSGSLEAIGMTVDPMLPVHPTFLYESVWNIALAVALFATRKNKRFHGQALFLYLAGYGLGRAIIEGMRVDSLMIGMTGARVSQALSAALFVLFGATMIVMLARNKEKLPWPVDVAAAEPAVDTTAAEPAADAGPAGETGAGETGAGMTYSGETDAGAQGGVGLTDDADGYGSEPGDSRIENERADGSEERADGKDAASATDGDAVGGGKPGNA